MSFANDSHVANIVHETERQRQFIRIVLPSTILIDKQEYRLLDLSIGGFKIAHDKMTDALFEAGEQEVVLNFNFNQFSFKIDAYARPVYKKNKEIGYKFTQIERQQLSLLRHVVKSYLSGQIMGVNDIISIVARTDYSEPTRRRNVQEAPDLKQKISRAIPLILVTIIGIIMLFFIAGNIYENQRFIKSYSGIVDGDVFTLRADKDGVFESLLSDEATSVKKDQDIGRFKASGRREVTLKSPCDCLIVQQSARNGEFKVMGEALYKLFPQNNTPYISTTIKSDQVERLKMANKVRARIHGEKNFRSGKLIQILPQENEFTRLKIKLDAPIPASWFSKPAYVEIMAF